MVGYRAGPGTGSSREEVAMNDEQVGRAIEEIERALTIEDPAFLQRLRRVQRNEIVHVVAVFALLAIGVVLLTAGLATAAVIPWATGLAALALAVVVDQVYGRHSRAIDRRHPSP
jgi:hypothetical protein